MAKTSMINRETRRSKLVARHAKKRAELKAAIVDPNVSFEVQQDAIFRLQKLPRDSSPVRRRNRCAITGRPRGFYRKFGLGRNKLREAAMRGEIADYKESLRRRVAMLEGTDAGLLQRVLDDKLRLSPGAEDLVRACQRAGLKTLLVTGGFTFFTDRMRERLGFDYTRANELEVINGRLTGRVTGPAGGEIIDADGKARALAEACEHLGCSTGRAIAIGDGANDLKMLKLAGISVAYRAKPIVHQQATYALNYARLDGVLAWFASESRAISQPSAE